MLLVFNDLREIIPDLDGRKGLVEISNIHTDQERSVNCLLVIHIFVHR